MNNELFDDGDNDDEPPEIAVAPTTVMAPAPAPVQEPSLAPAPRPENRAQDEDGGVDWPEPQCEGMQAAFEASLRCH